MKIFKNSLFVLVVIIFAVSFVTINGCKKTDDDDKVSNSDQVALCTDCGQIKGSDLCCKPDQPKCDKCGLVEGSPGCCAIPKGAETAALCTKCGQLKGSESCCDPDAPKCTKCGLAKGSPGCCKLPK